MLTKKQEKAIEKLFEAYHEAASAISMDTWLGNLMAEYLDAHEVTVKNDLIINDKEEKVHVPDLRKNNTNRVTIHRPTLWSIQHGYVEWGEEDFTGAVCDITGYDIVEFIATDDGVLRHDLMKHCYKQARYLGYRNPHLTIQQAIHGIAVDKGMILTSKREGSTQLTFKLMTEKEAMHIMSGVLARTPKAAVVAFESGLRPSRLICTDYLPYHATLLRQLLHQILSK